MALADYFKGPKHKAEARRLQSDLEAHRLQAQSEFQALQAKYQDLEAKAKQIGLLDLLDTQALIKDEAKRLSALKDQISDANKELQSARSKLLLAQQQILGAEDTIQLESFALYTPKYRLTNSLEYKARLDVLREEQKRSARGLSAEVDTWESQAVELTKAQPD